MTRQIHRQIWGLMFPATCISISVSTAYTHVQWVGKHSLAKDSAKLIQNWGISCRAMSYKF